MYRIVYGLLYGISLLPWFVMYGISNFLAFLNWHVIGYRKKVVLQNLRIAFPEKTEAERISIAKEFYRNFMDTLVESVKVISISDRALEKKFIPPTDVLEELSAVRGSLHLHAMHNFNWEIVNLGLSKTWDRTFMAVYMPIANPHLEKIFYRLRSRYGTILVPATEFKTNFRKFERDQYTIALVADQNPGSPANAFWANFFSKPAPFVRGPEKSARNRNHAVAVGNFFPVRRGVYSFHAKVLTHHAAETSEGELTLAYIRYVESCIRERPANYLWSHKRWKHEWKPEYQAATLEPLKT